MVWSWENFVKWQFLYTPIRVWNMNVPQSLERQQSKKNCFMMSFFLVCKLYKIGQKVFHISKEAKWHISQKKPNALKFPKMYNFCFGQNNRAGVKMWTFSNVLQHITHKIYNIPIRQTIKHFSGKFKWIVLSQEYTEPIPDLFPLRYG